MAEEICPTLRRSSPRASALPLQQLRQLGEVRRHAAGLVLRQQRENGPNVSVTGQGRQYLLPVLLTSLGN
jgi:hypothetical protein